jgi:signal transduction histidine kinase
LQFQVDVPQEPVRISTDRRALRQIVTNLASNAIKYTEVGSVQIELVLRNTDGRTYAEIHVRDTGIGIDPDDIARLFAPFERIDSSTARKAGGAGLGLHLSRRFAELLNGKLECTSQPGSGSTFTLLLPA